MEKISGGGTQLPGKSGKGIKSEKGTRLPGKSGKGFFFREKKIILSLSNIDIEKIMKTVKYFRGVFSSDLLPNKMKNKESGIINLQTSLEPGSHWICYYNNTDNKYVEYFDSYGLPSSEKIKSYLKTSGKLIHCE